MNIGHLVATIDADNTKFIRGITQANTHMAGFEKRITRSGAVVDGAFNSIAASAKRMAGALAVIGVTTGLGALVGQAARVGIEFEQSMATVAGITRATADEFEMLTGIAKEMGATTEWTASQSADALKFLGMAGFEATQAVKALPGVLDLATAGSLDLGRAADIASNALTAMQIPVGQLSRVNDVFIATITRSNTDIEQMADAFKYSAPIANAFGYSIEQLSAIIGKLGDAGIQGSMAGTSLARAMQDAREYAAEMGLASGDLLSVLDHLKSSGGDLGDVIFEVFEQRAAKAALILADVTDETRSFTETLAGAKGESTRLADIMRDTVGGSFKTLKSVLQDVAISGFDLYGGNLKSLIDDATQWVREHKESILAFADVSVTALNLLARAVGGVLEVVGGGLQGATIFSDIRTQADEAARSVQSLDEEISGVFDLDDQQLTAEKFFKALTYSLVDAAAFAAAGITSIVSFTAGAIWELIKTVLKDIAQIGVVIDAVGKAITGAGTFDDVTAALSGIKAPDVSGLWKTLSDEMTKTWGDFYKETAAEWLKAIYNPATADVLIAGLNPQGSPVAQGGVAGAGGVSPGASPFAGVSAPPLIGGEDIDPVHQMMMGGVSPIETMCKAEETWQMTVKRVVDEWEKGVTNIEGRTWDALSIMESSFSQLSGGVTEMMFGMRDSLADIFKGIAMDWVKFFIDEALKALKVKFVGQVVNLVTSIFDNPVNDALAAKEGYRVAMFMQQGFVAGFSQQDMANIVTKAVGDAGANGGQASPVVNHYHFDGVVTEDFQSETIRRASLASKRRAVQFRTVRDEQFGDSIALGGLIG